MDSEFTGGPFRLRWLAYAALTTLTILTVGAFIVGLTCLMISGPAAAQTACAPFNDMRASLLKNAHQVELAGGLVNERAVIVVFGTPDGSTWTIVALGADGNACIVANGVSWFQSDLQKGDPV